jgi:cytochrome c6
MLASVRPTVLALGLAVLSQAGVAADPASQLAFGKKLFLETAVPTCAVCHTLADAGSTGDVGPVLDDIKPSTLRVLNALKSGLGQMPSFQGLLSEAEMQAIALYVAKASGAKN